MRIDDRISGLRVTNEWHVYFSTMSQPCLIYFLRAVLCSLVYKCPEYKHKCTWCSHYVLFCYKLVLLRTKFPLNLYSNYKLMLHKVEDIENSFFTYGSPWKDNGYWKGLVSKSFKIYWVHFNKWWRTNSPIEVYFKFYMNRTFRMPTNPKS